MIRALNVVCGWIDTVAYRPAVIKLTERSPFQWNCHLARLSIRLDERWGTGYWASGAAGPRPDVLCDACGRRPAYLVVGETDEELEPDASYLEQHPVELCRWCQLDPWLPSETRQDVERKLNEARSRSVSWRWRWRPL